MIGKEVGPIPYERALPLFTQLVDAVTYAHGQGVVHRDLNPSNVLVTSDNRIKVTDFGIAKVAGQSKLTRTGTVLGTPVYMPPEQILGRPVDHRADIYSLGMTLYVMLAGRAPFDNEELSEFAFMKACLEDPIPDPRDFYPYIPDELVSIVQKALTRDISTRYQACDSFSAQLNDLNSERPSVEVTAETSEQLNVKYSGTLSVTTDMSRSEIILKESIINGMQFVRIPGGRFIVGAGDFDEHREECERPRHTVELFPFEMMTTQVTQAMWQTVMGSNEEMEDNQPIQRATWYDLQLFIQWLCYNDQYYLYRLPTEAEWEYACKAGVNDSRFWWGNDYAQLEKYAWYGNNAQSITHCVGQKLPNPWGLYDMLGNVWEWCNDWYDEEYYQQSPFSNPTGPLNGITKVIRGGSWFSQSKFCRPTARSSHWPGTRNIFGCGFRLIRKSVNTSKEEMEFEDWVWENFNEWDATC